MDYKDKWGDFLEHSEGIVVFDTETSGIKAGQNVILSLSWQVLDSNLNTISEQTRYFDWPEDISRVNPGAININKLTRSRLAELGTVDKAKGLEEFADVLANASMLVAHNAKFDISFIREEMKENNVEASNIRRLALFDTMVDMTLYCKLPPNGHHHGIGGYKYPRLSELADYLKIDTSDIDFHQSAADVEVTVRCLREIAKNGLVPPRTR